MRTWMIALSAVGLLATACGSDGATTPPGAAPVATSSTSTGSSAAPVTTSGPTSSTIGGTPAETVQPDPARTVVLSSSGIATYEFGAPRSVVEPLLTAELGPPDIDEDSQHQLAACVQWGCTQGVVMFWREAGLRVGFAERGIAADEVVLAAWTVSTGDWWPGRVEVVAGPATPLSQPPIRLSTASGIGLGSAMSDVSAAYPSGSLPRMERLDLRTEWLLRPRQPARPATTRRRPGQAVGHRHPGRAQRGRSQPRRRRGGGPTHSCCARGVSADTSGRGLGRGLRDARAQPTCTKRERCPTQRR